MPNEITEERRNLEKGECPVDLMGVLQKNAKEGEILAFTLTADAFLAMCANHFKKEVTFYQPYGDRQSVGVVFCESKQFIVFATHDNCKTFDVCEAKTDEFTYQMSPEVTPTHRYIIDVKKAA